VVCVLHDPSYVIAGSSRLYLVLRSDLNGSRLEKKNKDMMMDLTGYRDGEEGVTVMALDKEKQEVVDSVRSRLGRCKDITDPLRRKVVIQNLQRFLKEMETLEMTARLHGIWIVTEGRLVFFDVPRQYAETWSLKKYALFQDVPRSYLEDVFNNQVMVRAVRAERNQRLVKLEGTEHKNREVGVMTPVEFSKMDAPFVLFGKHLSPKLEVPRTAVATVPRDLSWAEVMEVHHRKERLEIHQRLQKTMDKMTNPRESDILLYKKDIPVALEEYSIKELYVLRSRVLENSYLHENENQSVKIYIVDPVEPGDITETLDRDLEGVLGVRYF